MNGHWKWLATALLTILVGSGGYAWSRLDERTAEIEARAGLHEQRLAVTDERYAEILRRLERIELAVESIEPPSVRVGPSRR